MLPYHPRPEEAGRNAAKQHVVTSKAASERGNLEGVFLRVIAAMSQEEPARLHSVQHPVAAC